MTFRRARTEDQRAERRRTILATAAAMLAEMPVSDVTLNELSRRVGLAKSNVLRYVGSREGALLDLLHLEAGSWLNAVRAETAAHSDIRERVERLADVLAGTLAARPVLCDLLGEQFAVLERNVSADLARDHKRATLGTLSALAEQIRRHLPELPVEDAFRLASAVWLFSGTVATAARPNPAVKAALASDPALDVLHLEVAPTLHDLVAVLATGLLDPSDRSAAGPSSRPLP